LKGAGSQKPTKIQMTRFKPVARAWTELFVKSIEACSNSSEIQLDVALAAKMIVEKFNTHTKLNVFHLKNNEDVVLDVGYEGSLEKEKRVAE
jgi:hypothetical protein